jgi:hypothetical protein
VRNHRCLGLANLPLDDVVARRYAVQMQAEAHLWGPATTASIPAWADLSHEEQALWTRIVLAEQQEREARR